MKTKTTITTATPVGATIACAPGAIAGGPRRTRFFDGMFLTQADLENEQRYWRTKRRLTNRALGQGVVWGLRLTWDGERHTFTLSPGYAIDCCGNDLVVECPLEITESQLWQLADPSLVSGTRSFTSGAKDAIYVREGDLRSACVVLQYVECPEDARAVYRDACSGSTSACEASRIRETARLLLVPPPSPPPLSPPEQFYKDLIAFRDHLPSDVQKLLFPSLSTSPSPQPAPQSGAAPFVVRVTAPDSPDASVDLRPTEGSDVSGGPLIVHQTPPAGRPSGIVTFELVPDIGWSFTSGTVRDGTRVVEQVSPPVSMSMYWALDVAVPQQGQTEKMEFIFNVDQLQLAEVFGARRTGEATFTIKGIVAVTAATAGTPAGGVDVAVSEILVHTEISTITGGGTGDSCFASVVPWGWAIETAEGATIAKVLVLAAIYATLSEVIQRGAGATWLALAYLLFYLAWLLLFGANVAARVDPKYLTQLIDLLVTLFERWCAGFIYPGPRCGDEHHGVYLGCGELRTNGSFASFDQWTNRRYVLTGPLFTHWTGLFGIAPVDVMVGRFADAICCLSTQDVLGAVTQVAGGGEAAGSTGIGLTGRIIRPEVSLALANRLAVGSAGDVSKSAEAKGAPLRWVSSDEIATRVLQLFARADTSGPTEMIATSIAGGGSVGVLVPVAAAAPPSQVRTDVATGLRTGANKVSARVRAPLTDLAVNVVGATPVSALVAPDAPPAVASLAKQLDAKRITVGALLDGGADATLARAGIASPDAATRDAADQLIDRAETALDGVTAGLARAAAPGIGTGVNDAAFVQRASSEVNKAFGGRLPSDAIAAAAKRVATPG